MSATPRPSSTTPRLSVENIPEELTTLPQWVTWRYELRDRKWTKVPCDPRTGKRAKTNDSATWTGFEDALARAQSYDGIGFFFSRDDPYCGIDLDECLDGEQPVPEARAILEQIASYSEVSPSGRGVKAIVKARLPGHRGRRTKPPGFRQIEMYDSGRFFALTGWIPPTSHCAIEDRQVVIDRIYARFFQKEKAGAESRRSTAPCPRVAGEGFPGSDDELIEIAKFAGNGAKFARLFAGDCSGYPSRSEADQALCDIFAFYTGSDLPRIDRLFRCSGLCRDKWTSRPDYREETIRKAIEGCTKFYAPRPQRVEPAPKSGPPFPTPRAAGPHGLALDFRAVRDTGKRWAIYARLLGDGADLGPLNATATDKGRDHALSRVRQLLADAGRALSGDAIEDVRRWLWPLLDPDRLAAVAVDLRRVAAAASAGGSRKEPATVAARFLRERLGLAFREPGGSLWSETLPAAIRPYEIQAHGGSALLAELMKSGLGFENLDADPVTMLGRTERVARAAFAQLVHELPNEAGAKLGPESAAAGRFRDNVLEAFVGVNASLRIGTRTSASPTTEWTTTSLAGLLRELFWREREAIERTGGIPQRPPWSGWQRIHTGFDAWVMIRAGTRGHVEPVIVFRPILLRQARVSAPRYPTAVFHQIARAYGVATADEVRVEKGLRALVLAPTLAAELLGNDETDDGSGGAK